MKIDLRFLTPAAVLWAVLLGAQPSPTFEAATIKPARPPAGGRMTGMETRSLRIDPGRLSYGNVSLRDCIREAWDLKDYQIDGPKSLASGRYDVVATAPSAATGAQMRLMLRALLQERFRMTVHRETRDLPILEMTQGSKPKLKASPADAVFEKGIDGGHLFYNHISMAQFADTLSGLKHIPVIDKTGLAGFYDISLDIYEDPAEMSKSMIRGDFGDAATATVTAQLGLRLEPRKGPIPMLVVDQAEKTPIEN